MKNLKVMHFIMWSRQEIGIDCDSDKIVMHTFQSRIGNTSPLVIKTMR